MRKEPSLSLLRRIAELREPSLDAEIALRISSGIRFVRALRAEPSAFSTQVRRARAEKNETIFPVRLGEHRDPVDVLSPLQPRSKQIIPLGERLIDVFQTKATCISSASHSLSSNQVLALVSDQLASEGFTVELGKKETQKVPVPVLFGRNGKVEKCFYADAYHKAEGFVLEIEAGRAVDNNQFLKDLFQACMMHEVKYLAIALRMTYRNGKDFETVCRFFETMYASGRLSLPLIGVLVIGY